MEKCGYAFSDIFFSSILLNVEKNEDLEGVAYIGGKDPESLSDNKGQPHIE